LVSQNSYNIAANDNVTSIFVLKRANQTYYDNLFSFNDGDTNGDLVWYQSNNNLRLYWNGSNTTAILTAGEGLLTVDNANNGSNGLNTYVNGAAVLTGPNRGTRAYYSKLTIGANGSSADSGYGYEGIIQEIIVLKANGTNKHMEANDMRKIHSYLAIKYGITLVGAGNYFNSDNTVVWDKPANAPYNYNIFGIGRDDKSGLYQKQSRSANTELITAYLGNTLTTLNSQNTATIADDGTFLVFGSETGASIKQLTGVNPNQAYENGSINMSEDPNVQSPIYKTQLTGAASMTLNLKVSMSDYSYVLVSNDPAFPAGASGTRIYPIVNYIAQNVEINQNYKFIKLIGFAPGPGGITAGLRLWLRADEPASLTTEDRPVSDALATGNNLSNYTGYTGTTVTAVSEWKDLVRAQTYSYAAGGTAAAHRIPVLKRNSPEMNYYPAVQFWGSANSYGSYLSNAATNIMPWDTPPDGKHTAYFMVNNNFSTNPWIYMLSFGSATTGTIPRPGYGVERYTSGDANGNITGRFRTSGDETSARLNLFSPGATSMLGYQTRTNTSGTNNYAYFRFNGRDDNSSTAPSAGDREFNWNNIHFQRVSMLGPGYAYNRTIQGYMSEVILFDRQLNDQDTRKLESYLAFKYGVTLSPSNTATNRFNYTLSNGTIVWEGDTQSGKFVDFYHNISAVIRDDAARLNNRHSHSTNVGSLLHMGVAGSLLSADGSETGTLENDLEAIVSGNDGAIGNTHISDPAECGDFTDRFNRKWLIHKETSNRPVALLIGAQNNAGLTIGNDASVANNYYNHLGPGFDVSMIVGDSPAAIEAGNYKAVIPMPYINGEHQCNYIFTDEDTYITFGWKSNGTGCVGDEDAQFTGTKKFEWTQWNSRTNQASTSATALTIPAAPFSAVDLGDNIQVTGTRVVYPNNVRAVRGYPRSANMPAKGSLEVRRQRGTIDQDVVVTVDFNHPVIPEFSISDLDCTSRSFEEVEIYGECSGNTYLPVLSYASTPSAAKYVINGNIATVTKTGSVTGSNKNGMLNVAFLGGVTKITIKYRTKIRATNTTQNIYISPITLRPVPPPPPVNEDGLSFVKQVKEREITTCEPVEYSFYIGNTNCDPMVVNFNDVLPENMKWEAGSFGLDAVSSNANLATFDPQINPAVSGTGEELVINGLIVPGAATLRLTATAVLDENAPSGQYDNRASITYNRIVNNIPVLVPPFYSIDRETLEPYTSFDAVYSQRQDEVVMAPAYSRQAYSANGEIVVTYTVNNTNADITDMLLDVVFNEEFTLVGNVSVTQVSGSAVVPVPVRVTPDPDSPNQFTIAGAVDGYDGFVLPTGVMEIKFTLKAPPLADIVDEVDDAGVPTGKKVDLEINYDFSSGMDDPCVQTSIRGLQGSKRIPYSEITHIITNKNESTRILK
jgi:hypothetical protein